MEDFVKVAATPPPPRLHPTALLTVAAQKRTN